MRNLAILTGLVLAAEAMPAAAQEIDTASQRLELIGDARAACLLGAPVAGNAVNATFSVNGLTSGTIGIGQFVNQQTGQTQASSIELNFPVTCNASHRITLRSGNGGMLRAGAASGAQRGGGFAEFVAYRLQMDWNAQSLDQTSEAGTGEITSAQAGKGDLSLRVATPEGSGPLVAGQYNDTIVIEFQVAN